MCTEYINKASTLVQMKCIPPGFETIHKLSGLPPVTIKEKNSEMRFEEDWSNDEAAYRAKARRARPTAPRASVARPAEACTGWPVVAFRGAWEGPASMGSLGRTLSSG